MMLFSSTKTPFVSLFHVALVSTVLALGRYSAGVTVSTDRGLSNISELLSAIPPDTLQNKRPIYGPKQSPPDALPRAIDIKRVPFTLPQGVQNIHAMRRCQFSNGTLWPSATDCEDELGSGACETIFSGNKKQIRRGMESPRPLTCLNKELADLARRCAKTCAFCCETPQFNCKDSGGMLIDCATHKAKCKEPSWRRVMMSMCEHTCGLCTADACFDAADDCASLAHLCFHHAVSPLVRQQCARSCRVCTPQGLTQRGTASQEVLDVQRTPKEVIVLVRKNSQISTSTAQPNDAICQDVSPSCADNSGLCEDKIYFDFLKDKCAKTCGHCGGPSDDQPPFGNAYGNRRTNDNGEEEGEAEAETEAKEEDDDDDDQQFEAVRRIRNRPFAVAGDTVDAREKKVHAANVSMPRKSNGKFADGVIIKIGGGGQNEHIELRGQRGETLRISREIVLDADNDTDDKGESDAADKGRETYQTTKKRPNLSPLFVILERALQPQVQLKSGEEEKTENAKAGEEFPPEGLRGIGFRRILIFPEGRNRDGTERGAQGDGETQKKKASSSRSNADGEIAHGQKRKKKPEKEREKQHKNEEQKEEELRIETGGRNSDEQEDGPSAAGEGNDRWEERMRENERRTDNIRERENQRQSEDERKRENERQIEDERKQENERQIEDERKRENERQIEDERERENERQREDERKRENERQSEDERKRENERQIDSMMVEVVGKTANQRGRNRTNREQLHDRRPSTERETDQNVADASQRKSLTSGQPSAAGTKLQQEVGHGPRKSIPPAHETPTEDKNGRTDQPKQQSDERTFGTAGRRRDDGAFGVQKLSAEERASRNKSLLPTSVDQSKPSADEKSSSNSSNLPSDQSRRSNPKSIAVDKQSPPSSTKPLPGQRAPNMPTGNSVLSQRILQLLRNLRIAKEAVANYEAGRRRKRSDASNDVDDQQLQQSTKKTMDDEQNQSDQDIGQNPTDQDNPQNPIDQDNDQNPTDQDNGGQNLSDQENGQKPSNQSRIRHGQKATIAEQDFLERVPQEKPPDEKKREENEWGEQQIVEELLFSGEEIEDEMEEDEEKIVDEIMEEEKRKEKGEEEEEQQEKGQEEEEEEKLGHEEELEQRKELSKQAPEQAMVDELLGQLEPEEYDDDDDQLFINTVGAVLKEIGAALAADELSRHIGQPEAAQKLPSLLEDNDDGTAAKDDEDEEEAKAGEEEEEKQHKQETIQMMDENEQQVLGDQLRPRIKEENDNDQWDHSREEDTDQQRRQDTLSADDEGGNNAPWSPADQPEHATVVQQAAKAPPLTTADFGRTAGDEGGRYGRWRDDDDDKTPRGDRFRSNSDEFSRTELPVDGRQSRGGTFDGVLRDRGGRAVRVEDVPGGISGALERVRLRYGFGNGTMEEMLANLLLDTERDIADGLRAILVEIKKLGKPSAADRQRHPTNNGISEDDEVGGRGGGGGLSGRSLLPRTVGMKKRKEGAEEGARGQREEENGEGKSDRTIGSRRNSVGSGEARRKDRAGAADKRPTDQSLSDRTLRQLLKLLVESDGKKSAADPFALVALAQNGGDKGGGDAPPTLEEELLELIKKRQRKAMDESSREGGEKKKPKPQDPPPGANRRRRILAAAARAAVAVSSRPNRAMASTAAVVPRHVVLSSGGPTSSGYRLMPIIGPGSQVPVPAQVYVTGQGNFLPPANAGQQQAALLIGNINKGANVGSGPSPVYPMPVLPQQQQPGGQAVPATQPQQMIKQQQAVAWPQQVVVQLPQQLQQQTQPVLQQPQQPQTLYVQQQPVQQVQAVPAVQPPSQQPQQQQQPQIVAAQRSAQQLWLPNQQQKPQQNLQQAVAVDTPAGMASAAGLPRSAALPLLQPGARVATSRGSFAMLRNSAIGGTIVGPKCRDFHPYCEQIVPRGFCISEVYPLRTKREYCPQSCGLC